MTNTHSDPLPPGRQEPIGVSTNRHYRLTNAEWTLNNKRFKPADIKVLYYLRTINPFGDGWIDIVVTRMADELGIDKSTVSRALKRLACAEEIDLEIQTARVRLISRAPVLPPGNSLPPRNTLPTGNSLPTDHDRCLQETSAIATQHLSDHSDLKLAQGGSSKNENVPNKEQTCSNKQTGKKADSLRSIDSGVLGTSADSYNEDVETLLALVREARVNPNKTITQTILETLQSQGSAAGAKAVENAISALKEAQDKRYVKNAGGFLVAALRQNFTANAAKKAAREKESSLPETLPGEPPSTIPIADLSETIALITCELERLHWSKDQAIAHMVEQWGWRNIGFNRLTDDDLTDLLAELQGLRDEE